MREKHFYDARIELSAGISLNFFSRSGNRQRLAIGPVGDHRVKSVCNGEYSRTQRNLLAAQAAGISGPVVALLVRQHDFGSFLEKRDSFQHSVSDIAMAAHDFAFFCC